MSDVRSESIDPRGLYRTIVADPPWPISDFPEWADGKGSIATPYPTMTVEEITALPVRAMSDHRDADAHLYLWTVNAYLRDAFDIARTWGFHPAQTIVWCKDTRRDRLGWDTWGNESLGTAEVAA